MSKYDNIKTFDELIDLEHGKIGTESRREYEEGAQMFIVSEMLKEEHLDVDFIVSSRQIKMKKKKQ